MVYFIVISCSIYTCNCFEGHRVVSVLELLLSAVLSLNKAYYYYYYYYTQFKLFRYRLLSHSFAALTSWTFEGKIDVHARPCNVLNICSLLITRIEQLSYEVKQNNYLSVVAYLPKPIAETNN